MKNGDILLFKAERDLISQLIAWGTDSVYSHVAVCVATDMNLAIESMTRGGVRARDISRIPQDYDVYRIKEGYNYDLSKTVTFLVTQLNNKYDYWGVIYLGILKLASKVFKKLKPMANKWQKDRDYFCSELCYEAFNNGGLDIVPEIDSSAITSPGDISESSVIEQII
jgi:uncharacterized protein YycO